MAKLFNNIRKKLVADKPSTTRTVNYLKYAIGEIVLVVFGILIALSINNWNEHKKENNQITKILTEVRNNLVTDSIVITRVYKQNFEDVNIQKKLIKRLDDKQPLDSSINKSLGHVMLRRNSILVSNGYDLLKKIGVEKIEDLKLRHALIIYYEYTVTSIYSETNDDDGEFNNVLLPYVRHNFADWSFGEYGIPNDYVKLENDSFFKTALKINLENRISTTNVLKRGLNNLAKLKLLLDKHLKILKN
ncbi:MAG: DUF6090 family protein [Flavobacteriaceae bacterium]